MELIQRLREVFLQVAERVLDLLDGDVDYSTFQQELAKQLNDCDVSICREVLESADMWIKVSVKVSTPTNFLFAMR